MSAYYNENDSKTAVWLRELIKAGLIADGEVDTRSIVDVQASDLAGFVQCHFFAGIGGWSYALRLAGWADDRAVWTGSCPCQPFSSAGAQVGGDDPRHLWPAWVRLIRKRKPAVVFGEQVESAIAHGWLDLVCDDLEREGYAVGAVGLPAACVGAPHIRQRVWFVAESSREGTGRQFTGQTITGGDKQEDGISRANGQSAGELADPEHAERRPQREHRANGCDGTDGGRSEAHRESGTCGEVHELADANGRRQRERAQQHSDSASDSTDRDSYWQHVGGCDDVEQLGHASGTRLSEQRSEWRTSRGEAGAGARQAVERTNTSTPWADLVWLPCRDGKARPTQSGLQPLAHGVSGRVGRLRGYGNAIVPQVAAEVIGAYMDLVDERP